VLGLAALRFRVSDADDGRRLDQVLTGQAEIPSRARAESLVSDGAVTVNGARRPKSHRLSAGDLVEVELDLRAGLTPETLDITVVHADEHLLVVDKPAGLVVHPSGPHASGTLVHGLVSLGAAGGESDRPGIVHRLDRDTSGLLLVARSPDVHRRLQRMIRERSVERRYVTLVRGAPRSRTGRIDAPIGRDRRDRLRISLDTDTPRDAVTWFELTERLGPRSLLDVRLETGRTHQIRVHLAAIELPVCGDRVYGVADDLGLERQFLHAYRLAFVHPVSASRLVLDSPLPADLEQALERARARHGRYDSSCP
jgi:23S rRNA pseudouridine1911/1915/1917 synthase